MAVPDVEHLGTRYRKSILKPGGSREELDSLKVGFAPCSLGRDLTSFPRNSLVVNRMQRHLPMHCLVLRKLPINENFVFFVLYHTVTVLGSAARLSAKRAS